MLVNTTHRLNIKAAAYLDTESIKELSLETLTNFSIVGDVEVCGSLIVIEGRESVLRVPSEDGPEFEELFTQMYPGVDVPPGVYYFDEACAVIAVKDLSLRDTIELIATTPFYMAVMTEGTGITSLLRTVEELAMMKNFATSLGVWWNDAPLMYVSKSSVQPLLYPLLVSSGLVETARRALEEKDPFGSMQVMYIINREFPMLGDILLETAGLSFHALRYYLRKGK